MLRPKPSLNIVATILAKNEEDIIAANIEHHLCQGVSRILLTDNNSSDNTREIAARYPEVEVFDEPGDDHRQSEWVTRMARLACKLQPDWIIHLDADELWLGLASLRYETAAAVGCDRMYLHPPVRSEFDLLKMRFYLDFENLVWLPGECKVAHRPNPDIEIQHGNHGIAGVELSYTKNVWRHHYPVRSLGQFARKASGHLSLQRRQVVCERWQNWYNQYLSGNLDVLYENACAAWDDMVLCPNRDSLLSLLRLWSTPEVVKSFETADALPCIGEWPRRLNER